MSKQAQYCKYFIDGIENLSAECAIIDDSIQPNLPDILKEYLLHQLYYLAELDDASFMEEMAYSLVKLKPN